MKIMWSITINMDNRAIHFISKKDPKIDPQKDTEFYKIFINNKKLSQNNKKIIIFHRISKLYK